MFLDRLDILYTYYYTLLLYIFNMQYIGRISRKSWKQNDQMEAKMDTSICSWKQNGQMDTSMCSIAKNGVQGLGRK